jgi:hypothetical protein
VTKGLIRYYGAEAAERIAEGAENPDCRVPIRQLLRRDSGLSNPGKFLSESDSKAMHPLS